MSDIPNVDIVADGVHMPECPRWHDGHLWFSAIRGHLVCRIGSQEPCIGRGVQRPSTSPALPLQQCPAM
jgi:hypothetical protein